MSLDEPVRPDHHQPSSRTNENERDRADEDPVEPAQSQKVALLLKDF
jgi:hypothetical protein